MNLWEVQPPSTNKQKIHGIFFYLLSLVGPRLGEGEAEISSPASKYAGYRGGGQKELESLRETNQTIERRATYCPNCLLAESVTIRKRKAPTSKQQEEATEGCMAWCLISSPLYMP